MAKQKAAETYLPLSEATYYVMLALLEPLHGYGVMQEVERLSEGVVKVGAGTVYGVFSTLEEAGLIVMVSEERRRKSYALTEQGKAVLLAQIARLDVMTERGKSVRPRLTGECDLEG